MLQTKGLTVNLETVATRAKSQIRVAAKRHDKKRAVNLTLDEALVEQAKRYTTNLSATMQTLLASYVDQKQQARALRQQEADDCVAGWNAVHAAVGSFADEHSTL